MHLKRKCFPLFGVLKLRVDVDQLNREMELIDKSYKGVWGDLMSSGIYGKLCAQHEDLHARFKSEEGVYSGYEQLSLTEYNIKKYNQSSLERISQIESDKIKKYKIDNARKEDNCRSHVPENDERCYDKIRDPIREVAPYTVSVLNAFKGHVTRVRYAKLAPFFSIKPHIDYDTSYSVRYHIALKTTREAYLAVRRNKEEEFTKKHIPCDGQVYFMNTGYEHFAGNDNASERVHLVIGVDGQEDIQHLVKDSIAV